MDEADTLRAFFELLLGFSSVITFNGDSFDIRFIRDRAKKHGINPHDFDRIKSLDLFKTVKRFSKFLNTPDCRQKTIEQYYGLFREDRYNGGQLIDIYKQYSMRPDPEMLETLLLHNHEDVKGMLTVMNVLELSRLAEILEAFGDFDTTRPDELIFHFPAKLHQNIVVSDVYYTVSVKSDGVTVILHPKNGELAHFYSNYRDYCYIPDEALLIPKSLTSTIDRSRIEKATKENCCTKHTGTYLPITDEKGHRIFDSADTLTFKKSYSDKQLFIEIDPADISEAFMLEYIRSLVKYIF